MILIFMGSSLLLPEYVCHRSLEDQPLSASLEILQLAALQSSSKATTAQYECVPNVITVCPTGDRALFSSIVGIMSALTSRLPYHRFGGWWKEANLARNV